MTGGTRTRVQLAKVGAAGFGALALVAVGGTVASAAPTAYNAPFVVCQAATDGHGGVSVTAIGFDPTEPSTYSYPGGSGTGTSFSVTGLPAGTTFTSTVSGSYTEGTKTVSQSCTSTIVIGGAAAAVSGAASPAVAGGAGSLSDAAKPVVFTAPVSVKGTTAKKATVLGESITRSTGKTSGSSVAAPVSATGAATTSSAPASSLAFTGADGVVTTGIVGLSLLAGGGAFLMAGRKRSRRSRA